MLNVCEASPDSYVTKYAGVCFPPLPSTRKANNVKWHLSGVNLHLSGVKCHFSSVTLTLVKLK